MSACFERFQLLSPLLRAVAEEAYTTPTPVQVEAIPHVLAGRALLSELLQAPAAGRVLVFTRTKRRADHAAQQLSRSGIRADAISVRLGAARYRRAW